MLKAKKLLSLFDSSSDEESIEIEAASSDCRDESRTKSNTGTCDALDSPFRDNVIITSQKDVTPSRIGTPLKRHFTGPKDPDDTPQPGLKGSMSGKVVQERSSTITSKKPHNKKICRMLDYSSEEENFENESSPTALQECALLGMMDSASDHLLLKVADNGCQKNPSEVDGVSNKEPITKKTSNVSEDTGSCAFSMEDPTSITISLSNQPAKCQTSESKSRNKFTDLAAFVGDELQFLHPDHSRISHENFKEKDPIKTLTGPENDFYGLGQAVQDVLFSLYNINSLHDWQKKMLDEQLSDNGLMKNGLVLAPTSGGKTLVSIVLMLHTLHIRKKDVILCLPYKAIVAEKVRELKLLASSLRSFFVVEYAGVKGIFPVPKRNASLGRMYVGTNEKLSLVWKFLCKDGERRKEIGMVVLDEFHMVGEDTRGATIEEFLTSVMHWSGRTTRIICLSATVGNPGVMSLYLGGGNSENCNVYKVTKRPIVITENIVVLGSVFPIERDEEGQGKILFSGSGKTDGSDKPSSVSSTSRRIPYDLSSCFQLAGGNMERGFPVLWLKMCQLKEHLSMFGKIQTTSANGTLKVQFPAITAIPESVKSLLEASAEPSTSVGGPSPQFNTRLTELIEVDVRFREAILKVMKSGCASPESAGRAWTDYCSKLSNLQDPFRDRSMVLRQNNEAAWDFLTVTNLVMDSMVNGKSVLIFCDSREKCVNMCEKLSSCIENLSRSDNAGQTSLLKASPAVLQERKNIIGHLLTESKGMVHRVLLRGIHSGIGFHSAALHAVERLAIEMAFSKGVISALCCTSTLAAGVNLPAHRVIICSPWVSKEKFLTCARYMQMSGRAGRTGCVTSKPDSYILIQPKDVSRFQSIVDRHVENISSQLLHSRAFYRNAIPSSHSAVPRPDANFSGITRLILNAVAIRGGISLAAIIQLYQKTLLFQCSEEVGRNLRPLLAELLHLIKKGHLEVFSKSADGLKKVISVNVVDSVEHEISNVVFDDSPLILDEEMDSLTPLTSSEAADFVKGLSDFETEDHIDIPDVNLFTSPLAAAATSGSLSLDESAEFINECERFEKCLGVINSLTVMYISLNVEITKPISGGEFSEHHTTYMLIENELLNTYETHPDFEVMERIGIKRNKLECWRQHITAGQSRVNPVFHDCLRRLWSAMFLRDVIESPGGFETACNKYGFCRGAALELMSDTINRMTGLKNFCMALHRFWWYPPLVSSLIKNLGDCTDEEIRPLLSLVHTTVERAKAMVKMGIRTVQDVAEIYPPTILSDNIKYLSRWQSVEIVLDARMQLKQEAITFAAQAEDRIAVLG